MWGYVPSCILDPLGSPHPNPCLIPVRLYPPPHNYLLLLIQMLCPGLLGSDQCLRSHTANCILGHQSHVYNGGPLDLPPSSNATAIWALPAYSVMWAQIEVP